MSTGRIEIAEPVVGDEEWEALRGPLESGWLTQGPRVAEFERRFAEHHQVAHAIAVSSCTTGLHLALVALGIGPGDEVIVPAFTWVATANAVVYCGATPIFVDVEPNTYNLAATHVADAVTERTRAVIPVHLFGLCADVDALKAAMPDHVALVEDAACAVGARFRGRSAGSLGDVGVFSFHPRKIITTGEGGMVTTSDDAMAERIRSLRNHGATVSEETRHAGPRPWLLPDFDELGFNYRMTDIQGAVGVVQMERLDGLLEVRRTRAAWYERELVGLGWLQTPTAPADHLHSWQAYVTVVDDDAPTDRNTMMSELHQQGISTRPGTHAVPGLGWYRSHAGTSLDDVPVAARLEERTMAIPLHNRMDDDDFERVVRALRAL